MTKTATAPADAPSVGANLGLKPAVWVNTSPTGRTARPSTPSPYIPHVQASFSQAGEDGIGAAFELELQLDGDTLEAQVKELQKHLNLMNKAGKQTSLTVQARAGEIAENGSVTVTFRARKKIVRTPKAEADPAAVAA